MKMKKVFASVLSLCLLVNLLPYVSAVEQYPDSHVIELHSREQANGTYEHEAKLDNVPMEMFDYTWHVDPSKVHDEVKDAPAEYFTGEKPETDAAAYIAHDIAYYPSLDQSKFVQTAYDGEWEYAYYYTASEYEEYIFSTLPMTRNGVPTSMMHTPEEAATNPVLHIAKPGVYVLSGEWHGQIWVDLGSKSKTDESAKVTLVLNDLSVNCTVAPGIVFRNVYECDNAWEQRSEYSADVDTSTAGANIIVADGTTNSVSGTNIFRMLKPVYKEETTPNPMNPMGSANGVKTQKKQRKIDGAVYSYVTMNIGAEAQGTGILNINAGYEGLDSELHLTINGGNINIASQDDGINVNEDNVSVFAIHGGNVHILAGLGAEGDGIDSNGYLMMTGGTLISMASPFADSGMDSERGTHIKGGTVVALGSTMDWAEADETGTPGSQAAMNLRFAASQSADEAIIVTTTDGRVVFAYDPDKDEVTGDNARWYMGAIISSPAITVGNSYYVYVGGDIQGTERLGVYDVSTVGAVSEESKQQCYSETANLGGFRPGPPPGPFDLNDPNANFMSPPPPGPPPFPFDPNDPNANFMPPPPPGPGMPGMPNGQPSGNVGTESPENLPPEAFQQGSMNPGTMPPNGQPFGTMPPPDLGIPNGQPNGNMGMENPENLPPEAFQSSQPQDGFMAPPPPDFGSGVSAQANGNGTREFLMSDRVNGFSGVTDYTGIPMNAATTAYSDTQPEEFYYDAMNYVAEHKIMSGTDAEHFSPYDDTTRLMLMTSLARMDGVDTGDVSVSEQGRQWAMDAKTPDGQEISNGERMDEAVTRQQLAAMLYRYALYRRAADMTTETEPRSFTDADHISEYAQEAVQWCSERGIVQGYEDGSFHPERTASRAHMAIMLYRFHTFLTNSVAQTPPPSPQIPSITEEPEAQNLQTSPQLPPVREEPESQTPQAPPGPPPQMPPQTPPVTDNPEAQSPQAPPPPPQTPLQINE